MPADFSGYATKSNVPCSDGRTILPNAFPDADGARVPLVWQHGHSDVNNVLGHAVLEVRPDGVYANGYFNDTDSAKNARLAVQNKDITAMSIYANRLQQDGNLVKHGIIREVSLVLSGANPEARIENVYIQHSDGFSEERDDEGGEREEHLEHSRECAVEPGRAEARGKAECAADTHTERGRREPDPD